MENIYNMNSFDKYKYYCIFVDCQQEQKELKDCLDFAVSNGYNLAADKIKNLIL